MNEKLLSLKDEIKSRLGETQDLTDLDKIRVSYLGKKGSITHCSDRHAAYLPAIDSALRCCVHWPTART